MKQFFRIVLLLATAACAAIPVPAQTAPAPMRLRTVVIDPGHGGKDPGCISKDGKVYEKTVTLDVGKRLAKKIKETYPDVEVKMTRTEDVFVELENRAVIANKANANLFISIHVNAVEKGTAANGYSIHCLGQSSRKGNDLFSKNLDLVKRENAVIKLEKDYAATYQGFDPDDPQSSIIFSLMQNAHLGQSLDFAADVEHAMGTSPIHNSRGISQDPFWVLWRTAMPSVLVELGFITNPDDLSVLRTSQGRESLADNLLRAFGTFKARYEGDGRSEPAMTPQPNPAMTPQSQPEPAVIPGPDRESPLFGIQVLATGKSLDHKDPFFRGYEPVVIPAGKINKYVICTSSSLSTVKQKLTEIQKKFPDCYVVRIENGATSPVK
ncbi:MAG: N-acetylmuramoyl-L-alanine amidase [Bacteroidales bacterium]|nr:N-acetylmuramoyl-L-alanine amidase [Bacteroidales bacterium]